MNKKIFIVFLIISFLAVTMGCAEWSRNQKGAAIGAGAGGAVGGVIGYATGSDEYNLELSRRRAGSVANYLATQNVNRVRFTTEGYGKTDPITSNETAEGRAQNRRVEVAIWANEKLKKVAKDKTS